MNSEHQPAKQLVTEDQPGVHATRGYELRGVLRGLFLQGDVIGAYSAISACLDRPAWAERLQQRLRHRFSGGNPVERWHTSAPWIKHVLSSYAAYHREVLTKHLPEDAAAASLLLRLRTLTGTGDASDLEQVEALLQTEFSQKGICFQGGKTSPFYGPYVWLRTEQRDYTVELPDGHLQPVRVYFLHDFLMRGWLHYASCGLFGTAGWAKSDGLYCVYPVYRRSLPSQRFTVSFLQHEAQHLADYHSFSLLPSSVLEYRAKAVELIYRPDARLLQRFATEASEDRSIPHAWAAYCLLRDISRSLTRQTHAGPTDCLRFSPGQRQQAALDCYRRSAYGLKAVLDQLAAGEPAKLLALTDSSHLGGLQNCTRAAWSAEWLAATERLLEGGWHAM